MDDNTVFIQHPRNGARILRSQTNNLRSWDIPRTRQALQVLQDELRQDRYPSLYILFEGDKNVYIGETENIIGRIRSHSDNPQEHIVEWDRVLIINDGRTARFSDFNDTAVRHSLEYYLNNLFRVNGYNVVSHSRNQDLTAYQITVLNTNIEEINLLLFRSNLISRLLDRPGEQEVFIDELREILESKGFEIERWGQYEAVISGVKYFIRDGSDKPKGWQITSRGRKTGSFIDSVVKGEGYLIVRRGGVLIIPLELIKNVTGIQRDDERDTIDIFITFSEGRVFLKYHDENIEITKYRLLN